MPNFFTTTIKTDPRFGSTARISAIELLEPVTRQAVQDIISDARDTFEIELMVFETYRSQARQQELFNKHVTKLKVVGVHHYGLACDLVKVVNGEPSWKGDFSFLGELAESYGLIWGGDWGTPNRPHSFIDSVHVQRCSIRRQSKLFREEWYPDADYDPYDD